jgi:predicted phage-related endonuclease
VDISDFIKNLVAGIANDIQGAFQIIKEIKVDTGQIKNALYEIRDEGIKLKMQ